MGKATLTFNMPEESEEFELAYHGYKYHAVLWDLEQQLIQWIDHDGQEFPTVVEALEGVKEELFRLMEDREVTFKM